MRYLSRDKNIFDLAKAKKVLHLGCVGFADLETSDRVKLAKDLLHFNLTEIAETAGIDKSSVVIQYYQENNILDVRIKFDQLELTRNLDKVQTTARFFIDKVVEG